MSLRVRAAGQPLLEDRVQIRWGWVLYLPRQLVYSYNRLIHSVAHQAAEQVQNQTDIYSKAF